jgi:3-oxoadipate enol-lactonase
LEFVVDDLIILLDQLKIEKTVVCGLSMGGFVALRAVERNPDRFTGLVLADTKSEPNSDKSKIGRY